MKVKSEREVSQSCPTLSMDCSPPRSSIHGIFQARVLEWGAIAFSRDLPDPGIEPASLMSPASHMSAAFAVRLFTIRATEVEKEMATHSSILA